MELKDTTRFMSSNDYKERFKAEYWQLKIRYEKLNEMLVKYSAKKLEFEPKCPIDILRRQKNAMAKYLFQLEVRAKIEEIDLGDK